MLSAFIDTTNACETADALFAAFQDYGAAHHADALSYHILAAKLRQISFSEGFQWHCFPEAWVEHYRAQNYFQDDPIISVARRALRPYRWFEVDKRITLSPDQIRYLADLRRFGFVDGWAVPIFGPEGGCAYFGIGSTRDLLDYDRSDLTDLQFACQQVHIRYLEIRGGEFLEPTTLTSREREVLKWMARGKSKSVIAQILGISRHTVDTLSRRCFRKLDVNDRISAVLRGVTLGIITLDEPSAQPA